MSDRAEREAAVAFLRLGSDIRRETMKRLGHDESEGTVDPLIPYVEQGRVAEVLAVALGVIEERIAVSRA